MSDAALKVAWVQREGSKFLVHAWWGPPGQDHHQVVLTSADGFRSVDRERWHWRRWSEWFPAPEPPGNRPDLPELEGLLQGPADTTLDRVRGVVGGSDGATLFPFEAIARSDDGGQTWRRYDVPRFDGEMGFLSGEAVLPDGTFLALVDDFSDDTFHRPSQRHHGLWRSTQDWSSLSPSRPAFDPPLTPTEEGWSPIQSLGASTPGGGAVWVTTWDNRLYVSTDGALTFREIPAK